MASVANNVLISGSSAQLGWNVKRCVVANEHKITHVLVEFSLKLQCVLRNWRNGFPDNICVTVWP